jgi:hypothetical protein
VIRGWALLRGASGYPERERWSGARAVLRKVIAVPARADERCSLK